MGKKPLINIITRTCARPKAFERNVKSVKNQSYTHVNHVVVVDDDSTMDYVNKHVVDSVVKVDKQDIIANDYSKYINPYTGRYTPVNLYFNHIHDHVKEGWVMYVDDDNYIAEDVLSKVVNVINKCDEDTMIYFKMRRQWGLTIPNSYYMRSGMRPGICMIGGCCFTYHTKYINDVLWDGWKCADFRFMDKLYDIIPNKAWFEKVVIEAPIPGECALNDIE